MDKLHDDVLSAYVVHLLHACGVAVIDTLGQLTQRMICSNRRAIKGWSDALKVFITHVKSARNQVTPAICQVGVIDLLHALEGNAGVLTRGDVGHEVVAVALNTQQVQNILRCNGVSAGLAHLLNNAGLRVTDVKEAVSKNVLRHSLTKSHKHCRPNDAVEADDVLTNNVHLSWPETLSHSSSLWAIITVANSGVVVEKSVKPNVGYVRLIKRNRNTPVKTGTRYRNILEARLNKAAYLVCTEVWLNEIWVLSIELKQLVLECGKFEEPRLLRNALKLTMAIWAEVCTLATSLFVCLFYLGLGEEGLLVDAVPTIVGSLIDEASLTHALPQVLDSFYVTLIGSTDEVII